MHNILPNLLIFRFYEDFQTNNPYMPSMNRLLAHVWNVSLELVSVMNLKKGHILCKISYKTRMHDRKSVPCSYFDFFSWLILRHIRYTYTNTIFWSNLKKSIVSQFFFFFHGGFMGLFWLQIISKIVCIWFWFFFGWFSSYSGWLLMAKIIVGFNVLQINGSFDYNWQKKHLEIFIWKIIMLF